MKIALKTYLIDLAKHDDPSFISVRVLTIFVFLVFSLVVRAQDPHYISYNMKDGLPSSQTYQAFEDQDSNMWFTTDRGIVRYNSYGFKTYTTKDGLSNLVSFGFYKEDCQRFWLNGYDGSFTFWNGHGFVPFKHNAKIKKLLDKDRWFHILNITDQKLFFCLNIVSESPKEFYEIDRTTGDITRRIFSEEVVNDSNISPLLKYKLQKNRHEDVYIEIESENELWRTTKKITEYYPKSSTQIDPIKLFNKVPISSVFRTSQGHYWFTTLDRGLLFVPSLEIKNLVDNSGFDKLKLFKNILVAQVSGKNEIFIFKNEKEYFFSNTTSFKKNHQIIQNFPGVHKDDVYQLIPLHHKLSTNQFARFRGGVIQLTNGGRLNNKIVFSEKMKTLSAVEGKDQILWVGTAENLYSLDLKKTPYSLNRVPLFENDGTAIRINDVILDNDGIWLATLSKGLIYRDNKAILMNHEMFNNRTFECVFKENDTTIWAGTNKGLLKIQYQFVHNEPKILNVVSFTTNDGLSSNKINDITFWRNQLVLATDNGVNYFDPTRLAKNFTKPKLKIENILVNGLDSIFTRTTSFKYDQNNIKIQYAAYSLNKPISPKPQYRYKLNGQDWIYTNTKQIEYQSLEPNKYEFLVQSQNNDEIWSDVQKVAFTIQPHFTELLFFRVSIFFLSLLIVTFIVRGKIKASKERVSRDLRYKESELATLRNQMNPHFVFNSLNTLQDYILDGNIEEVNQYIGDFSILMRKSLEFSKIEKISLYQEIQFIENYLLLEKRRYEEKFDFQVKSNLEAQKQNIFMAPLMVQPLVENCVKHAFKSFNEENEGRIEVTYISTNKEFLVVEVIDNGIGFEKKDNDTSREHQSMGIYIIQERLKLMNQKYRKDVFNLEQISLSEGTKMRLTLPIFFK